MLVVKQITFVDEVPLLGSVCLTESLSTTTPKFRPPTKSSQSADTIQEMLKGGKKYTIFTSTWRRPLSQSPRARLNILPLFCCLHEWKCLH